MSKVQFFDRVDGKLGKQFTAYIFFFFYTISFVNIALI